MSPGPAAGHALDGLELLPQAARAQLDLRAHRAAVADLARQADPERRLPAAAVVPQRDQAPALGTAGRAQHQVGVAVAVDIARRHPGRARDRRERQHRPHRDARGRRSAAAGVAHLQQHGARGGDDVEASVVVEIDELRRAHAVEAVDRRRREAPAPVAGGEDARRPGAAEEEVGEAVLVHVGGGDRGDPGRRGAQRRQADVAGDVGERAVAQVLEQRRRAGAARDQQIDVAAIVDVGRHDGDRPLRRLRDPRCGRDVGERAVAVVAQQDRRGAADDEIEVAVVVGVDERDRRGRTGGRRNAGRLGGVLERAVGALVQQRVLLLAEHEQIGALVVVVIARDRGDERRRQRQRRQALGGRDVAERPAGRCPGCAGAPPRRRDRGRRPDRDRRGSRRRRAVRHRSASARPRTAPRPSSQRVGLRRPSTAPLRRSVPVRGSCSRTRCRSRLRAAPGTSRSSAALPRSCRPASARRRGCRARSRGTAPPRPPAAAARGRGRTRASASPAAPGSRGRRGRCRRWPAPSRTRHRRRRPDSRTWRSGRGCSAAAARPAPPRRPPSRPRRRPRGPARRTARSRG